MGWKDWSYAKKGLIVGLIIVAIINLICLFGMFLLGWDPTGATGPGKNIISNFFLEIFWFPSLLIVIIAWNIFAILPEIPLNLQIIIFTFITLLSAAFIVAIGGVIGSFIGWVIGKIKSKNKKRVKKN